MTPHLIFAFSRELVKIADSQVIQNHPDDGLARGVLGAGAVGFAGLGGNNLGGFLNRKANDLEFNQNMSLARQRGDEAVQEFRRRADAANGLSLPAHSESVPSLDSGYRATPQEDRMFRQALDDHGTQLFTDPTKVPGGGVVTGESSYYHPGLPSKGIPKHVYLDMAGGQLPHVMAHEVGHMTGWRGLQNLPLGKLYSAGKIAPTLIGSLGAYEALSSKKRTPEERDKFLKNIRNATIAGGALALPQLAEEARASIRAVNMGRKVGRGLEYAKHLLPAYMTYAAKPVATTAAAALGVEGVRRYLKSRGTKPESAEQ